MKTYTNAGWNNPIRQVANVWGVIIPTNVPCTGVINGNGPSLNSFDPFEEENIDASWEDYLEETITCTNCEGTGRDEECECAFCNGKGEGRREDVDPDSGDGWETESLLLGSWKKNQDGQYEPDPTGEYSAIWSNANGSIIQVVLSRYCQKVASYCSPCYPGQADLDSGEGSILAYTLPPSAFSAPWIRFQGPAERRESDGYLNYPYGTDPEWSAPRLWAPVGYDEHPYDRLAEVLGPLGDSWEGGPSIFQFWFGDCFDPLTFLVSAKPDHWDTAVDRFIEFLHDSGREKGYIFDSLEDLLREHDLQDPGLNENLPDYVHATGQGIWYYSEILGGQELGDAGSYFAKIHDLADARREAVK